MTFSNFWDSFPKASESQNQINTSDYWSQFQSAEEPGLSESPINNNGIPPQEQQQNQSQDSSIANLR